MADQDDDDTFKIPHVVRVRANRDTKNGVKIVLSPKEILKQMGEADKALNGDSNDDEHDALHSLREWLSDIFEDPDRRRK